MEHQNTRVPRDINGLTVNQAGTMTRLFGVKLSPGAYAALDGAGVSVVATGINKDANNPAAVLAAGAQVQAVDGEALGAAAEAQAMKGERELEGQAVAVGFGVRLDLGLQARARQAQVVEDAREVGVELIDLGLGPLPGGAETEGRQDQSGADPRAAERARSGCLGRWCRSQRRRQ